MTKKEENWRLKEKPRYSRISDIIELAIYIQSRPLGITINEIAQRYKVSRRTAERMRDSLTTIFPDIYELDVPDNEKHWGFVDFSLGRLINISPKEIADLEKIARSTANNELQQVLDGLIIKLKALNSNKSKKAEDIIEAYLQTEGYAVRQMPANKIDVMALDTIREALLTSVKIKAVYHNKDRLLSPLGLVYGEKLYLIAKEEAKGDGIYTFKMHEISGLKLTDEHFDKGDFDLKEYTNRSFGIYQSEIMNVKLSFDKELSLEALEYNFHPTQKIKQEKDGSVTVTFRASGQREIFWHVFKWGKGCKILQPKSLADEYRAYLSENLANFK